MLMQRIWTRRNHTANCDIYRLFLIQEVVLGTLWAEYPSIFLQNISKKIKGDSARRGDCLGEQWNSETIFLRSDLEVNYFESGCEWAQHVLPKIVWVRSCRKFVHIDNAKETSFVRNEQHDWNETCPERRSIWQLCR